MNQCVICGERISEGYGQVCAGCRKRYGPVTGISPEDESSRLLAALLQIERRQHAQTRRKLEKAEHDRDRYRRRINTLTDGINGIIRKASKLRRPPCNAERQVWP